MFKSYLTGYIALIPVSLSALCIAGIVKDENISWPFALTLITGAPMVIN